MRRSVLRRQCRRDSEIASGSKMAVTPYRSAVTPSRRPVTPYRGLVTSKKGPVTALRPLTIDLLRRIPNSAISQRPRKTMLTISIKRLFRRFLVPCQNRRPTIARIAKYGLSWYIWRMRTDHKGEAMAPRAGRPPPRPRRAATVSSAVLKVRTTPDELAEIDTAAKRAGMPRADFIRRMVLAASGTAECLPPSSPPQPSTAVDSHERAAGAFHGVKAGYGRPGAWSWNCQSLLPTPWPLAPRRPRSERIRSCPRRCSSWVTPI